MTWRIASKANVKCSWILSVFYTRDFRPMLTLFKSLVLNILEYCCPLWAPHQVQGISRLEGVQRRFTSKIAGIQHLDYWKRLEVLNLMSLQRRRERYILLYAWKILHEKVPAGKLWNCLPKAVNSKDSLASFKEALDLFLKDIPDRPPVAGYSTANHNSLLDWLSYRNAF